MLLRWRSTVLLLSAKSRAIALFGRPAATWRSTSSSRLVNPCSGPETALRTSVSTRATSGSARRSEESAACSVQLQRRGFLVSQHAAGLCDQHAHTRSFVRRLELPPCLVRVPQPAKGRIRLPLRQFQRAVVLGGKRVEQTAVVALRGVFEFATGFPRLLEVSVRKEDLHAGGEQPGAAGRIRGLRERAANCADRSGCLALGMPQQREPRLWLVTGSRGLSKCGLGLIEPALQAIHLALAVQRVTHGGSVHRLREACRHPPRFLKRRAPLAAQLHEFGAMDQALPSVRHHLRLLLAPSRQCLRPGLGAAHLEKVLAVGNDAAVRQSGHDRRQLARRDRHHHFIQQAQAFLDAAHPHQSVSALVRGEGEEIRIAVTLRDALRFRCNVRHALPVALPRALQQHRYQQVTVLHVVAGSAIGETLRAPEPAGRVAGPSARRKIDPGPERTARSAWQVAGVLVCTMRPLQVLEVIFGTPKHVGGEGQMLQVLRVKGTLPVCLR